MRLDVYLVEKELCDSRTKAQRLIMAGEVAVDGKVITKPGTEIKGEPEITLSSAQPYPYVSRGGLKLEGALEYFEIDVKDFYVLDIGASTGGFTDCLLQRGASAVTAVDVGYGQLDWKLRNDSRVTVLEKTNARYLKEDDISQPVSFVVMDVSFISAAKILVNLKDFIRPDAGWLILIKPQFESTRDEIGKGGVIRSPEKHTAILKRTATALTEYGLMVTDATYSPVKGPKGNIEFWFRLQSEQTDKEPEFDSVVKEAHRALNG